MPRNVHVAQVQRTKLANHTAPPTELTLSLAAERTSHSDSNTDNSTGLSSLQHDIEHAAHLLPSQGPITVFIHHNTLHAFEDQPFEEAVLDAQQVLGCEPYLSEARYRRELEAGRIQPHDLHAVLLDDLDDHGDVLIGCLGTRHELQLTMLRFPLFDGTDDEISWFINEADALFRFRGELSATVRHRLLDSTKHWIQRDLLSSRKSTSSLANKVNESFLEKFEVADIENWNDQTWEAAALHLLWNLAWHGVSGAPEGKVVTSTAIRRRDALLDRTGLDIDLLVNPELTRYCAAYLDQGYAGWQLPKRDEGFLAAYCGLVCDSRPVESWLHDLPREMARVQNHQLSALASIAESLKDLGVSEAEQGEYLSRTLLALRGWAGMIWQMETNAEWTVRPARENTLVEYLAVRLILERIALKYVASRELNFQGPLSELRQFCRTTERSHPSVERRAFQVFQLAQLRCWSPADLDQLSPQEWKQLIDETEAFDSMQRRRLYQLAYERRYRNQTLDAVSVFAHRHPERTQVRSNPNPPAYQVFCCIDDREESFRRQLEEIDPEVETFGIAGFYGVAMYYRGAAEAHFRPLCPIVIKPQHYVTEEPVFSLDGSGARQADTRRRFGRLSHRLHLQTRTAAGGFVTGLLGSITSLPLILRILFPRLTARFGAIFRRVVDPQKTQLRLERTSPQPGPQSHQLGYTIDEMAKIVEGGLRAVGLTRDFPPLVFIMGHGSCSVNNPHEAAYDCGACGGGRGGPNGRAFAQMANEPRVRAILAQRGLTIPNEVFFVGGYHNTCDDSVSFYDLDRLPSMHWDLFSRAKRSLDEARQADAHERCRRFESASFSLSHASALKHVENRSEDLSQVRPEYCHATNAVCFVGRRSRNRGLFLDRRSFLTSYDPTIDDEQSSILAGLLGAVIPVCCGY